MRLQDCLKKTNQLDFRGGINFWSDALYLLDNNRFEAGTRIIVLVRIAPLVKQHGILISNRVQFVTFKLSPLVKIGIICIYVHKISHQDK
jgi:hypothetical protein